MLRAHGYEPRHRILLSGPPGNGKTSFAESVAEALSLPYFIVRYDALIGSYLGETNARLRKLFDFVRSRPCVLFFDEFDSIGKERGDSHETGEIKRVVSFLLLQLDQLPSNVVVIAATNHAELLDRAVWRRFQYRLNFPMPTRAAVEVLLDRIIERWPEAPSRTLPEMSVDLSSATYSEVVDFCQNVRRRQILGLGAVSVDDAIDHEMKIWKSRVQPEVRHEAGSQEAPSQSDSRSTARRSTRKTTKQTES
ncbi:AAA family ATPase [Stenotrophomonas sp. 22385]|uniref:AAA family ATPase n=1 Tax=Stenotrophomonas sp. 22385 TaxID=3453915 RepID=UPI003F855741